MSNYSEIAIPLGSPFMRNRGLHNSANSYRALDFVTDGKGSTYVCLRDLIAGVPLIEGADWVFITKGAYQAWLEIEGNEDKTFQDWLDWMRQPAADAVADEELKSRVDVVETTLEDLLQKEVIIERESYLMFPTLGESNTIYIDTNTNKSYRWDVINLKYYILSDESFKIIDGGN